MPDLFISYKSDEREAARRVAEHFEGLGYDVFWDADTPNGVKWDQHIRAQVAAASATLVLWSRRSVTSDNVVHEAQIAKDRGTYIPVLIEPLNTNELPMGMPRTQMASIYGKGDAAAREWEKLEAEVLELVLAKAPTWLLRLATKFHVKLDRANARQRAAEAKAVALEHEAKRDADAQVAADMKLRTLADELTRVQEESKALRGKLISADQNILTLRGENDLLRASQRQPTVPEREPTMEEILASIRRIIDEETAAA